MRYLSTRAKAEGEGVSLSEAIESGAPADGGLYMPARLPALDDGSRRGADIPDLAATALSGFFAGDALEPALPAICRDALSFDFPLKQAGNGARVLELFHGPTAAFKDVGARFLAACLVSMGARDAPRTVLVATSGDTGGAVAAAFHRRPGFRVVILYPRDGVSPLQAHQLSCWGANVRTLAVSGNFDDCQRIVKEAFANRDLCEKAGLTSANSINIGRLLPQIVYYVYAAGMLADGEGEAPGFIVPSGNLGNVTACVVAREMGARIGPIVLACNANRTVQDFFETGEWRPRPGVATLANAMDVGDPSNMERLRWIFGNDSRLRSALAAVSIADAEITDLLQRAWLRSREVWCPHTATGLCAYEGLPASARAARPWVVAATAHAAKFREVVEEATGHRVSLPPSLAALLERPARAEAVKPRLKDIEKFILN